jgi:hypothetical protein
MGAAGLERLTRWESRPPQTAPNPGTGILEKIGQEAAHDCTIT